jgi:hypothetical protein
MVFRNLIFQPEVVEQRLRPVVLSHHDQQASDDQNQTEHGQMLSSNMLLLNLILLIDVTFSTPTPVFDSYARLELKHVLRAIRRDVEANGAQGMAQRCSRFFG